MRERPFSSFFLSLNVSYALNWVSSGTKTSNRKWVTCPFKWMFVALTIVINVIHEYHWKIGRTKTCHHEDGLQTENVCLTMFGYIYKLHDAHALDVVLWTISLFLLVFSYLCSRWFNTQLSLIRAFVRLFFEKFRHALRHLKNIFLLIKEIATLFFFARLVFVPLSPSLVSFLLFTTATFQFHTFQMHSQFHCFMQYSSMWKDLMWVQFSIKFNHFSFSSKHEIAHDVVMSQDNRLILINFLSRLHDLASWWSRDLAKKTIFFSNTIQMSIWEIKRSCWS